MGRNLRRGGRRRAVVALTGCAVAWLLAGCASGGDTPPVTVTTTVTSDASPDEDQPPAPPGPSASSGTSPSPSASSTSPASGGAPALPSQTRGIDIFRSPSGNILCAILHFDDEVTSAECEIETATFATKPEPADCDLDWQPRWVSTTAKSTTIGRCAGDPSAAWVYNKQYDGENSVVLAYGETTLVVDMACQSQQSGMTCWNVDTGRGFTLRKAGIATF